jgi:thiamine biosynthesis lipoprotein
MYFHQLQFRAMGTSCQLYLYADSARIAKSVAQRVVTDIERLEQKYSRYREDSYLSEINRCAKEGKSIQVDEETAALLNYADTCFRESDGLFDITSGILRAVWSAQKGHSNIPNTGFLNELLEKVGWQKLQWSNPELAFPVAGMELDLGGVVKEYAADRACSLCRDSAIQHGLINLGGDISVIGPHPDGSPWQVSIRHPTVQNTQVAQIELTCGALASSGDYERYITIEGDRYGHIINPLSGWPTRELVAVSVKANFCLVAGSAATIAMLKESKGKEWLQKLGTGYLWVDYEGHEYSSHL